MTSFKELIEDGQDALTNLRNLTLNDGPPAMTTTVDDASMLRTYTASLERKLLELLQEKERDAAVCKASAECTFAKNNAGRVLVAIFDHVMSAKVEALKTWWETGSIQTRSGPGHWRLDPRTLRDKRGYNLLHVTVDRNLAKESAKVAQIELLVNTMGFDVNSTDLVGRTSLHHAAINGYEEAVKCLLAKTSCNPLWRDKAGMTALSAVQQITGASETMIQALLAAEKRENDAQASVPSAWRTHGEAWTSLHCIMRLERYVDRGHERRFQQCTAKLRHAMDSYSSTQHVPFDAMIRESGLLEMLDAAIDDSTIEHDEYKALVTIEASGFSIYAPVDQVTYPHGSWVNWLQRSLLRRQRASTGERYTWYYAALFQAQMHELPGVLDVQQGRASVEYSSEFAVCLPLVNPIFIQGQSYWAITEQDTSLPNTLALDRPFEGVLELQERAPGNKFDTTSSEDEMVQDYQRLAPDHSYEIGIKIGPAATRQAASDLAKAWSHECKTLFRRRQCISGAACCAYSCPQRVGQYLCRQSAEKVGLDLALQTFGRSTYSKACATYSST
ncbi:hypothetical protein, variant 1, partial [Aphanomyces astaci]